MLNKYSNVNIEWIYCMHVNTALTMCIRNGKSVSTHNIDCDVHGPDGPVVCRTMSQSAY